jgi:adenine-specific DNA-methyltransferase
MDLITPTKVIGNGKHILVNSDNLHFFEKFKEEYENKIDVISIDPPYNTGKKMGKYKDNFGSITNWLEFLKPRLEYAKLFMSDNGLIFININDKNSPYLRILCDEIFGIDNFVSTIIWQNKYTVSNDNDGITTQTENILVYAKNIKKIKFNKDQLNDEYVKKTYKDWDGDSRGPWRKGVQLWKKKTTKTYTVTSPTGKQWTKGWNYSESQWENELVKNNLIYWGDDGNSCPTKKVFLKDSKGVNIKNLWLGNEVGYTQDGTKDLENDLCIEASFLYPKPIKLMKRILEISTNDDSVVMDFFAGSGTLGRAVQEYNQEKSKNIKFILITNNENNICEEITLNRISKFSTENEGLKYIVL